MERKEYLLSELPAELWDEVNFATFGMKIRATVGFTLDGVRYRIYPDEKAKAAAKALGIIDLLDALKGADVPVEDVEVAMDKLGFDAEKRRFYLAGIAEAKVNRAKTAKPSRDDAQI
jgi:hypothetical protein